MKCGDGPKRRTRTEESVEGRENKSERETGRVDGNTKTRVQKSTQGSVDRTYVRRGSRNSEVRDSTSELKDTRVSPWGH